MVKHIITVAAAAAALLCPASLRAATIFDNLTYYARLGYNLGGTAPVGMPATIRSLSKYTLKTNPTIALDAYKPLDEHWGLQAGFHIENKGMKTDARVKNYSMEMRQGGETLKGVFTGQVVTDVDQWMVTVPLWATYDVGHVRLKFGPFASYLLSNNFSGYAYDGHLRVGDPTGPRVELGSDEASRGTYDFSDEMRRLQFGLDLGADWHFSQHYGAFVDLSWGLLGVFKKSFKTIEQTMYPIYGTIGVTYKLK